VNNFKLFDPPLLKEEVTVRHLVDNIPYFHLPLLSNQNIDTQSRTTRKQKHISYQVSKNNKTLAQAKWMSIETVKCKFPHFLVEEGIFLGRNKEDLVHQQGNIPSFPTWHERFYHVFNYLYCSMPLPVF
jgi:hypothetical protein